MTGVDLSHMIRTSVEKFHKHPHKGFHTHATMEYLEQLLGILQEVKTVFDPTSRNLCSLLSDLFPSLTLCLTWVGEKDKEMLSYAEREGSNDRHIWMK